MISVRYRAYDRQNQVMQGTIAAANEQAAIDALYDLGLTPYETRAVGRSNVEVSVSPRPELAAPRSVKGELFAGTDRVGLKDLTEFTTELASLTTSGVALDDALRIISGPGTTKAVARLGTGILNELLAGSQLSDTLERRADVFAADYRAIVRAGETAGALGPALTQIADLLARRLEIRRKIAAALVYPLILLGMSVISVGVIVTFLLPSLAPIFIDANRPLPGILATLMQLQENWLALSLIIVIVLGATIVAWRIARRNPALVKAVDQIKAMLPLAGHLIRLREASRFMRALGTLVIAGVPLLSSLKTSLGLVSNRFLAAQYETAINQVPEGSAIHKAFGPSSLIPPPALRLVTIGEETGQLGSMLLRAAVLIETDHLRRVERMLGLLTPLLTLAIGGAVGSLIMAVMSAVLSVNDLAFQ